MFDRLIGKEVMVYLKMPKTINSLVYKSSAFYTMIKASGKILAVDNDFVVFDFDRIKSDNISPDFAKGEIVVNKSIINMIKVI